MSDLFRPEVAQARSGQWLGGVRLKHRLPAWAFTLGAALLAAALIAYAFIGEVTRKARISGVLIPTGGQLDLTAAAPGHVRELRVAEGQAVKAGETLLVLTLDRQSGLGETGGQVAQQIEARRATLAAERNFREIQIRLQQQSLSARVQALEMEIRRAEDEAALAERRRALAAQQVARQEELLRSGFVSPAQLQTQQQELLDHDTRLQQLSRTRLALQRDRQTLAAERDQLAAQLRTDLTLIERNEALLAQEAAENEARRMQVVVAPRDGVVTALALHAGQSVTAGQTLATLAPAGAALEAHLFAPSRTTGFVAPGQRVLLRYAAYPYQKFGLHAGRVASVSQSAFAPAQLPPAFAHLALAEQSREALYRVTVRLDSQQIAAYGAPQALKPGMTLEAEVIQDRRRIVEWILEPLIAVARRQSS
jgi:membrane fusion protein